MSEALQFISVIGGGIASAQVQEQARQVGSEIARQGFGLVCGGLGGVMEAACQGAAKEGGLTMGILPGNDPAQANPYVKVPVATGLGQARNLLVVLSGRGAIAISGRAGTLSEIGHALKSGRPVVGLGTWDIAGVEQAESPQEAVAKIMALIG